jgi:hypothetical protein
MFKSEQKTYNMAHKFLSFKFPAPTGLLGGAERQTFRLRLSLRKQKT